MFCNGNQDLFYFDAEGHLLDTHRFDFNINELFVDSDDNLWLGTIGQGFHKMEKPNSWETEKFYKGTAAVIAQGFDDGLWFKSDISKFGYISPSKAVCYSPQIGYKDLFEIESLGKIGEKLLIITDIGRLFIFDHESLKEITKEDLADLRASDKAYCYDKDSNILWISNFDQLDKWDGAKWKTLRFDENIFGPRLTIVKLIYTKDGRVFGATKKELFEVVNGEIIKIYEEISSSIQSFCIDENGKWWVSTVDGLMIFEDGGVKTAI